MKTKIFLLNILLISCLFSYSQEDASKEVYSISGSISDSLENKPLTYINITLLSAKDSIFIKSGITNETGNFKIEDIEKGEYLLRIINLSYNSLYKPISLNKDVTLDLFLNKSDAEIDEVVISADKEIYSLETDKRIYLTANDESIQNAFAEDALENAPGVYIDIDGNVIIRGKPASVWINGKPSRKSKEHLQSFLQTIPASRIEKIEVITNPSARYTATNINSIVNIVLKKKTNKKSLFAIGTVVNTANVFGLWSTLYITRKKIDFNIYAIGSMSALEYISNDRSFSIGNSDTSYYSEYQNYDFYNHLSGKIFSELTYRINNKTNVNLSAYYSNMFNTDSLETGIERRYDNPYSMESKIIEERNGYYVYFTLNLNHNFNKDEHSINFDFNTLKSFDNFNYYKHESYRLTGNALYRQSTPKEDYSFIEILANYQYPFKEKYRFAAGFNFSPVDYTDYKNIIDTSSNIDNTWSNDSVLSNEFLEKNQNYQVYTTFSGELISIKYKFGLRYEHQVYDLNQTIPDKNLNKLYSNFYPSIHLSHQTKSKHNFSLSYSRRVNTPIYHLNPYIDRTENEYIKSGNPNLNFAETNSYEFSYFKSFKNINVSASVYQRNTKNDIVKVSELVYDDYFMQNVVLQTYSNCADSKFTGTEISLSSSPVKNLRLNLYTNTYYQNLKGTYNNLSLTNQSFVYNANFNISYKFFNKFYVKLSPYYRSNNSDIFKNIKSNFYTRALIKFDLFNKRLSFNIKARDIFGTKRKISEYYFDNFYHYSEKDYEFQRVQFIAILRIGNSKFDRKAKINQLAR